MKEFDLTPVKGEGQPVSFGVSTMTTVIPNTQKVGTLTTYIERRVPVFLEDAAHKLIDKFLADHGYDPEAI
jgi:hypothetical protein